MEHQTSAGGPVPEVREGDNGLLRHPQQFVQQCHRVADLLNRAVDDGVVEAAVLQVRDSLVVQVTLDNLYVVFQAVCWDADEWQELYFEINEDDWHLREFDNNAKYYFVHGSDYETYEFEHYIDLTIG